MIETPKPLRLDLAAADRVMTCRAAEMHALAMAGGLDPAQDFRGLDLRGWPLAGQDLSGFDLTGCDLRGTGVEQARLGKDTKLDGARLDEGVKPGGGEVAALTEADLDALADHARQLHDKGESKALAALAESLLPLLESWFGAGHSKLRLIQGFVGFGEVRDGQSAAGLERLNRVLEPGRRDGKPEEDGNVLLWKFYRAEALLDVGRAAEALDELNNLLPLDEAVRGARDPSTLATRQGRARALLDLGRAAEAFDELNRLLPLEEAVRGARDPSTLFTRYYRVLALLDLGRAVEALDEWDSLLPLYEAVFGARGAFTFLIRHCRAFALLDLRRESDALDELRSVVEGYAASKGETHAWTNTARADEIGVRPALGEKGLSVELAILVENLARDRYPHAPAVLRARYRLVRFYLRDGQEAAARRQIAAVFALAAVPGVAQNRYVQAMQRLLADPNAIDLPP